ncbi:hypothetical protein V6Z11_A08G156900 [Gossypium hirsutum]
MKRKSPFFISFLFSVVILMYRGTEAVRGNIDVEVEAAVLGFLSFFLLQILRF